MTFYFYDLETTGISARDGRIMQFAGQRTDMDLQPIGEPHNILVKITPDILPDPEAILITKITPQKTLEEGVAEAEFLQTFHTEIATPDTIFIGFNSIRFDDEFMRYTNYRNFYDPYEWQWASGRSKWDLLDVVRMTRALRPDGITWPFASDGKAANKLELLASVNKLEHANAHDALSDVFATIAVAKLVKDTQPKLFDYLLQMRDKKKIQQLVSAGDPFVYTSGRYSADHEKTTVAVLIAPHPTQNGSVFVYDLRHDPTPFADMKPEEIAELLAKYKFEEGDLRLPVKQMQYNKCPTIAPIAVLDPKTKERLAIDDKTIATNLANLQRQTDLANRIQEAIRINEKSRQAKFIVDLQDVDAQLYDGFFNDDDKTKMRVVRGADETELADLHLDFADERLPKLLLLYKARQFPKSLTDAEQKAWDEYREQRLFAGEASSRIAKYFTRIQELSQQSSMSQSDKYLLEELSLYGQSITPYSD